jgi:hypothetical protein
MLVRIFKGNSPGTIILIAVMILAAWLSAFIHPSGQMGARFDSTAMPLYGLLVQATGESLIIRSSVAFLFTAGLIFLMTYFNTRDFFINERTFLPAMFYGLTPAFIPGFQQLNPAQPAAVLLILMLIRIMDSYRKPGLANNFFDAGILLSTGSLFYANVLWFGIIVIIGIVLIRSVTVSEVLIGIIGIITPYFLLAGIYYVTGKDLMAMYNLLRENLIGKVESFHYTRLEIGSAAVYSIITLIAFVYLLSHLGGKKVKSRQTFSLLIWTFLLTVTVYVVIPSASAEVLWLTAIPASYFLTHYFVFVRKGIIPQILLAIFLLTLAVVQIIYLRQATV